MRSDSLAGPKPCIDCASTYTAVEVRARVFHSATSISSWKLSPSSKVVLHQFSGGRMKHETHDGSGIDRKLHNPVEDRLIPLEPLDLSKVRSIDDLVRAMSNTAFTGRQLGEAADVLEAMARDKDCFVVMTLAGAMTVAKQGLIIAELIDRGIVNAIVSTGALMAHGD